MPTKKSTALKPGDRVKINEGNHDRSIPGRNDYFGTVVGPSKSDEGCLMVDASDGQYSFHASRLTKVR